VAAVRDRRALGERWLPPDDGWERVDALDDAAWRDLVARLDASDAAVERALRGAPPTRLAGSEKLLHFLVHHDVYHAGQIGLLRRA